ncbi:proline-rich protein 36 [Cyclopterus lumpus]|uniref:proline-rich protein 36 n=1 Tax=Cyclopterus lumpus TaxID=8103 RepID=UPI001487406A|nr:proline-rich protein 36 [Cyclopterus lumpus]
MESFSGDAGDTPGSTEDIPERKKSKLKSLKNRLFGRSKRGGGEGDAKLSHSVSDITAGKGPGSQEDLGCSQRMMVSRALSADSIFLADQVLPETEPARVLSQENVHSKIKALQMKLQQQKMHLGPPPLVLPARRAEDPGSRAEDGGLPHSLLEIPAALSKTPSQPSSRPLSPILKPVQSVPLAPSLPLSVPSNPSSSVVETPLDFSYPARFTPSLDTSAARHRLAVKPRNQRAGTKKTLHANHLNEQNSDTHALNNVNHPESVREEKQLSTPQEALTSETEQGGDVIPITSQRLPSKSPEVAPITSDAAHKSSSRAVPQQDQALPGRGPFAPSQVLRVKPHRPSERPHSSFIQSELKDNRDFEIQAMSLDKRNTLNKAGMTDASCDRLCTNFRSSSDPQRVQSETESKRRKRRPAPGSGSFHLSITAAKDRDGERPRSGSCVGGLEHIEARHKTVWGAEDKPSSSTREKEELRGVGRLRPEGAPHKSSAPSDRRGSLKQVESVTPSQHVTTDATKVEELGSNQETVEEARDVEDDEGKTAFGVKLRSTSLSMRFRSDSPSHHSAKLPVCEEQCDKSKEQEVGDLGSKDPTPSGFSLPVKHNPLPTDNPPTMATEVETTSSNLKEVETSTQEAQPAPQTASSEGTWMSLAMEKTRSLQQLFTSRFPRDLTGVQTAARPQAQQVQPQPVQLQKSTTPTEAADQAPTVNPPPMATQQKTPPLQPSTSREPQTLKLTSEPQLVSQSTSHPAAPTNPRTTQAADQASTDAVKAQTVKPSPMAAQQKTPPLQLSTSREPQTLKLSSEPQLASQSTSHPAALTNPRTTQAADQASTDAVKAQTVKPSPMAAQQKTPPLQPSTSREPQTLKLSSEPQLASQSTSHPAALTNPRTTQAADQASTDAVKAQTVKPSPMAAQQKTPPLQPSTSREPQTLKLSSGPQLASQSTSHPAALTNPRTTQAADQASTDAVKAQTVKPSPMAAQQKTPPLQLSTSREPQTLKLTIEPQLASQSTSHPAVPTNPRTTQSPSHSSTQAETSSPGATQSLAQLYLISGQQQPPRSSRGLQTVHQLKSTNLASTAPYASPPPRVSALGRGEREAAGKENEGASLSGRRAVWAGSVGEKASFLEKRAEWTAPRGTKGMELKKAHAEEQVSDESTASVKTKPQSKDMNPEGRQGVQLAEPSPAKDPERPQEDKWLQKNVAPSSSPSSSPTMPSAVQSVTGSSQPSWMELAKRKSMAWSDKSMD